MKQCMASESRNANFSKEEKLLLAELGKQYPDIGNNGYHYVSLKRKTSSREKVVQNFNARNHDGNKRDMKKNSGMLETHETTNQKEI